MFCAPGGNKTAARICSPAAQATLSSRTGKECGRPAMTRTIPADLAPTELMKAMGGRSWNPIPPDQHKWPMKNTSVPPLFRLWSWMLEHSIRKGRRKGYVCNDHGEAMTIIHAADQLGMDHGGCRRAW